MLKDKTTQMSGYQKVFLLVVFSINILSISNLYATDVFGSDISWMEAGKDSFIVSYEVISDCRSTGINNVTLTFRYKTTGGLILQEVLTPKSTVDATGTCSNQCTKCMTGCTSFGFGLKKITFTRLFVFSNLQYCEILVYPNTETRPYSINTGIGGKGFYTYAVFNACVSDSNRSPIFDGPKSMIACNTSDLIFDPMTSNPANDSLVFSFVSPMSDSAHTLSYSGQFSYEKPFEFWGFPNANQNYPLGIHLNRNNGILYFRPVKTGESMFTISVKIYRKGILIGETRREMGVIVISCPINNFPSITGSGMVSACAGTKINLNFYSDDIDKDDTVSFSIVHDLKNLAWQTNNGQVKKASATLLWTPEAEDYFHSPREIFIVAKDNNCPVSAQTIRRVLVNIWPDTIKADLTITKLDCGAYIFKAIPRGKIYNYKSDWTGNGNLQSNLDSFIYKYHKPGSYFVNYSIIADSACSENQVKYITTDTFIYTELPADSHICFGDSLTILPKIFFAKGQASYLWSNSDTTLTINTGMLQSPIKYIFTVTDSSLCTSTDTMEVIPGNFIYFYGIPDLCDKEDSFDIRPYAVPAGGKWKSWNKNLIAPNCFYVHPKKVSAGSYWLRYEYTEPISGCFTVDSTLLLINPSPVNVKILPLPPLCRNSNSLDLASFGSPSGGDWRCNVTAGENNNILYPNNLYSGTYKLYYTYYNQYGCSWADTESFTINPTVTLSFNTEDSKTNYCNSTLKVKLIGNPSGGSVICPGYIIDSCYFSPSLAKDSFTQQKVIYRYKHSSGCEVEKTINLNVFHAPEISIDSAGPFYNLDTAIALSATLKYSNALQWALVPNLASGTIFPNVNSRKMNYFSHIDDKKRSYFTLAVKSIGHSSVCNTVYDTFQFAACYSLSSFFGLSPKTIYVDSSISFIATTDTVFNIIRYLWYFGDGDSSQAQAPQHIYKNEGLYSVKLILTNSAGCISSSYRNLKVIKFISINEGIYHSNIIRIINLPQLYVILPITQQNITAYRIYNIIGECIAENTDIEKDRIELNKNDFKPGIYLISIEIDNKINLFFKLEM